MRLSYLLKFVRGYCYIRVFNTKLSNCPMIFSGSVNDYLVLYDNKKYYVEYMYDSDGFIDIFIS